MRASNSANALMDLSRPATAPCFGTQRFPARNRLFLESGLLTGRGLLFTLPLTKGPFGGFLLGHAGSLPSGVLPGNRQPVFYRQLRVHYPPVMAKNAYVTKWEPAVSSDGLRTGSLVHTIPMSNAYQVVFECRKCHQRIGVPRKSSKASLSEDEARKMFAGEDIQCPECRWRGKASRIKLLRIVPFNWICSPAA
jgi:hypothetical protein